MQIYLQLPSRSIFGEAKTKDLLAATLRRHGAPRGPKPPPAEVRYACSAGFVPQDRQYSQLACGHVWKINNHGCAIAHHELRLAKTRETERPSVPCGFAWRMLLVPPFGIKRCKLAACRKRQRKGSEWFRRTFVQAEGLPKHTTSAETLQTAVHSAAHPVG